MINHKVELSDQTIVCGLEALRAWMRGYQYAVSVNDTKGYLAGPYDYDVPEDRVDPIGS